MDTLAEELPFSIFGSLDDLEIEVEVSAVIHELTRHYVYDTESEIQISVWLLVDLRKIRPEVLCLLKTRVRIIYHHLEPGVCVRHGCHGNQDSHKCAGARRHAAAPCDREGNALPKHVNFLQGADYRKATAALHFLLLIHYYALTIVNWGSF